MIETLDPAFDKFSIFQYGCNCQFLMSGDRPMSHPGYGRPVDALDRICKEYRSCVKCLTDQHGSACIPEVTKYRWRVTNGEITSSNRPGTCERDTFECDLRLAVKLAQKDYTLNDNFHTFWTKIGFDYREDYWCSGDRDITAHEPGCCQPLDKQAPFHRYNKLTRQCCADGSIQKSCPVPEDDDEDANPANIYA